MSAVPPSVIDGAIDFILDHIRQASRNVEGDQTPGLDSPDTSINGGDDSKLREIDGELDSMAKTLPSLYTRLQARIKTRMIRRKRERNNLVRFNQLPSEVAFTILWLSIADPWERPSCSFLHRRRVISSTCSSWRSLVEDSPQFSSIIELTNSQKAVLALLEKSKCSPLEIKGVPDEQDDHGQWMDRIRRVGATHLELIAPHTHRIRSLTVSAHSTERILPLLDQPAPILEELQLSFRHCDLVQPLDLFCGQAGRLKDVVLENIPIRWDSGALAGLRSLKIKANRAYSPTETEVLRLLEANPELERIDMENATVTEGFAADVAGSSQVVKKLDRVVMSNMREMRLFSLPFELVRAILSTVDIPSIRHLDLKCLFRGQPASSLLGPRLQHLVSPILQRSTGTELAEVTLGQESVGLAIHLARQESPIIRIQLNNTAPVSGFGWLAENLFIGSGLPALGAPEIFQVSLKFCDRFDMEGDAFIPILDWLDAAKVEVLTIQRGCNRGEELIKYLGNMKEDSRWPLTHLKSLTVGGSADIANHLEVALQRRKSAIPLTETAPAVLEVLNIEELDMINQEVEDNLAELIGPNGTFIPARPILTRAQGRRRYRGGLML